MRTWLICGVAAMAFGLWSTGCDQADWCYRYCEDLSDCLDDLYEGDWGYTGYDDRDDYFDECWAIYDDPLPGSAYRTQQKLCKAADESIDYGGGC